MRKQLEESEAQKLECIEDEIALHKKHQELQKKVFGQSIKVTYFETLAKCYKELHNKGSSEEAKELRKQLEESEAQKLECIEDEIKLHKRH